MNTSNEALAVAGYHYERGIVRRAVPWIGPSVPPGWQSVTYDKALGEDGDTSGTGDMDTAHRVHCQTR